MPTIIRITKMAEQALKSVRLTVDVAHDVKKTTEQRSNERMVHRDKPIVKYWLAELGASQCGF